MNRRQFLGIGTASMAIQECSAVQEIGDVALREKLKERGQILERPT
jgi:hypothetical protein